jgi:RNA polymerase sigma-70 factor (ECF subfamily)
MSGRQAEGPGALPAALADDGATGADAALGAEPGWLEALLRLDGGDAHAAAARLLRERGAAVHDYLEAVLRDPARIRDAYSLCAEWAWAGLGRARGASTPRAWLFAVAHLAAGLAGGEAWPRVRDGYPAGEATALALQHAAPSGARRNAASDETLVRLHQHLTPSEQNLLALRLEQRLEWQEVADVLSADGGRVSATAARKRFERMKERIALLAREQGSVG